MTNSIQEPEYSMPTKEIELLKESKQLDSKPEGEPVSTEEIESLKAVYKICIETRNFEINQLIQRNNFFMLFQGVLLAAALQNQSSKPFVEIVICLAGIFVSIYQLQMASGAKFWQEWWESRVDHYEEKLHALKFKESGHFFDLFATKFDDVHEEITARFKKKGGSYFTNFLILRAFAVGRAPIKVGLVLVLVWFALFLQTIDFTTMPSFVSQVKGFTFVYPSK